MHRSTPAACAVALAMTVASFSADAVQRAFVASFGSDANTASNCALASPCRGFTAAMTVVDSGGEIVALDAAGYGNVVINKSVTVTSNPGFYAGISAVAGNAVTINTAGVTVTLRGLNLNGVGAQNGIFMGNGAKLSVENCVISNFATSGMNINTAATVRITDTTIRDNAVNGMILQSGSRTTVTRAVISGNGNIGVFAYSTLASTSTRVDVADSAINNNAKGLLAYVEGVSAEILASVDGSRIVQNALEGVGSNGGTSGFVAFTVSNNIIANHQNFGVVAYNAGGQVWATGNTVSYNGTGFNNATGVIESAGDNAMRNNGTDTTGTIGTVAKK